MTRYRRQRMNLEVTLATKAMRSRLAPPSSKSSSTCFTVRMRWFVAGAPDTLCWSAVLLLSQERHETTGETPATTCRYGEAVHDLDLYEFRCRLLQRLVALTILSFVYGCIWFRVSAVGQLE